MLVLLVCHAGYCRSPMMTAMLRANLGELEDSIDLRYMGVAGSQGRKPHWLALQELQRREIYAEDLTSEAPERELMRRADVVLCADYAQVDMLRSSPALKEGAVVALFAGTAIPDPIGGPGSSFALSADFIEDALPAVLETLRRKLSDRAS